jgi:hypothetical protein
MKSRFASAATLGVRGVNEHARRSTAGARLALLLLTTGLAGCVTPATLRSSLAREVEEAARPLLEMRPDANWTACYNRLLELAPASINHLASHPIMHRPAAPDDLRVALRTSLLRLLASPQAPRLSINCLETTLDVLHFDPNVRGQRIGRICLPSAQPPLAWHDLYPAEFNHGLAAEIDVEADRQNLLHWWQTHRDAAASWQVRRPLQPNPEHLWALLSRRYADLWSYEPKPQIFLCSLPPTGAAVLRCRTYDYNLVRAACIWLGASEAPGVQNELIERLAHPSPLVAYNARFALCYSQDPCIHQLLERYKEQVNPAASETPGSLLTGNVLDLAGASSSPPCLRACAGQRSATHEVDQTHPRLCIRHRCGHLHRRPVWWY